MIGPVTFFWASWGYVMRPWMAVLPSPVRAVLQAGAETRHAIVLDAWYPRSTYSPRQCSCPRCRYRRYR